MKKIRRLSGEERREQILEAALGVFSKKGLRGARTKEIADLAGVSDTLLFQHFKNKKGLYKAALKKLGGEHPVVPELEKLAAKNDDRGVFTSLATHMIKHGTEDTRFMRLAIFNILEGAGSPGFLSQIEETRSTLSAVDFLAHYIQSRIEQGAFRPVNARISALLFMQSLYMYVLDKQTSITGPPLPFSEEEVAQTLADIYLKGMTA